MQLASTQTVLPFLQYKQNKRITAIVRQKSGTQKKTQKRGTLI